ncbi:MAG: class I SAM-dependent methyltransferase [Spirochaetaceae bacterium]|jgi:16S rRNA (guanine527-N7)-methyltransferase|nr:class I SAM-dependent methyltransferase [Spirochaetaceae bacterium]
MGLLEDGIKVLCDTDSYAAALINPQFNTIINTLQLYIHEIERFNAAYGLVSYKNTDELIIKHILNSVSACGIIAQNIHHGCHEPDGLNGAAYSGHNPAARAHGAAAGIHGAEIADAGSGAGLPGIPLAILFPQCRLTLIERSHRRGGFLCHVKAVLGLKNVSVLNMDISEIKAAPYVVEPASGGFNVITFRAFHPMNKKLYISLAGLLSKDGVILAYKGRKERIQDEMAAFASNLPHWEMLPCPTPFLDEERTLLVIRPSKPVHAARVFLVRRGEPVG